MNFTTRSEHGAMDGYTWRCPQCYTMKSIRDGSFFAQSKLPLYKWQLLMQLWSRDYPVFDAVDNAEISEKTAIQIYQFFRDVCSTKLLQSPIILGGPHCKKILVVSTTEWLPWLQWSWDDSGYEKLILVLEDNCISNLSPNHTLQLTEHLRGSHYNHT